MSNKILIADDSKLVLSLVKSILEGNASSYTVLIAHDGKEAIKVALSEKPDLILMDWQMPELSGIEALIQLKLEPSTLDIPVIMLTASESTSEAFEAGAIDFISKPFNKNELLARVKSILESVNAKKELKQKLIENEIQRDKLKLQKDILVKQKKALYNQQGLASKVYQLLFSAEDKIDHIDNPNFILSIPLADIPSNMLWAKADGDILNFCIAFTAESETPSVLISAALLHSLNKMHEGNIFNDDISPSYVVKHLNDGLHNLDKKNTNILFCSYHNKKKVLQYAGANIPLYVMKKGKFVALNIEIFPQGISSELLINHKVQLADEDILYVLHDGFNEENISLTENDFISEELIKVFGKIFNKEMPKQCELLSKTFEIWKKDLRQVGDIFVFGLKA